MRSQFTRKDETIEVVGVYRPPVELFDSMVDIIQPRYTEFLIWIRNY